VNDAVICNDYRKVNELQNALRQREGSGI